MQPRDQGYDASLATFTNPQHRKTVVFVFEFLLSKKNPNIAICPRIYDDSGEKQRDRKRSFGPCLRIIPSNLIIVKAPKLKKTVIIRIQFKAILGELQRKNIKQLMRYSSLAILGLIGAALAAPPPCGSTNTQSDGYFDASSPPVGYEASPALEAKPANAKPAYKPKESKSSPIPKAREDDVFTAFTTEPQGTNVTSLNGASSEAEGNATVSVAADEDSGVASANAEEEGTAIGAAGAGQALGLSTSIRVEIGRPVDYTDGDYREYFQGPDGEWYYYPSPSPIPSPSPELSSSIQTMEGAKSDSSGNTTVSAGADKNSGAAGGNADEGGSVITGAQLGAALGVASS